MDKASWNASLLSEVNRLNVKLEERTSQLIEANEQLQCFTYSIAHDFRQHIRGIGINASILLSEASESLGEYQENVERIREVAHLMGQMSEDLLMHARLRREEMRLVEVDLSSLARSAAET